MLLIDADNVSVDVMEQGLRLLLNQHGAVHVRRAYCTAESAVKHQAFFKRMGIKPMVNLAAGKNSTDIALAVDAVDLVLAERPDVVVIASSDSDFAPLVQRLREKGCVVRGIGQLGKTGDETREVYDDYTVLEHHKAESVGAPARKTPARKTAAAKKAPAAKKAAAKKAPAARKTTSRRAAAKASASDATAAQATASETTDLAVAPQPAPVPEPVSAPAPAPLSAPLPAPVQPAPVAPRSGSARSAREDRPRDPPRPKLSIQAVLDCLPELAAGQSLALNTAVQRLREAQLLGKNSSSLKLFSLLSDRFELQPANKPSQVRLRA
jgi:uncharacterized protein (TIGR00288 family)